ncbi:MAG: hypothetical protein K0V04_28650 [Deltaproteobacteria bacterium]|nr:hypothetical protein [Deltaproteobacteria bacterium]
MKYRSAAMLAVFGTTTMLSIAGCDDDVPPADATESTSTGAETDDGVEPAFFTPAERDTILTWLGPLPATPPPDPSNAYADDPSAAALGQALFYDTRVSANGSVSCATCHDSASGYSDNRSNTSEGMGVTHRSSISILNGAYGAAGEEAQIWQFWDGRLDSQWAQALRPVEDSLEMGGSRSSVALLLFDQYREPYEAVFGLMPTLRANDGTPLVPAGVMPGDGVWETLPQSDQDAVNEVFVRFGKVIEAYERQLVSRNSRFDQMWQELADGAADSDALTDLEKEGLRVFIDQGRCLGCHSGPNFTDGQFHNIAVAQVGDNIPQSDLGRASGLQSLLVDEFNCAGPWSDHPNKAECAVSRLADAEGEIGAFKTPSLRSVNLTPPYMHTGQFDTLDQVIAHYDLGGGPPGSFDGVRDELMRPLGLDLPQRTALVAFLATLEGEPLDPALNSAP